MVQGLPYLDLESAKRAVGEINLPGSKSVSNRVLLLAALSKGETIVHGLLDSDDTKVMLGALHKLGLQVEDFGNHSVKVHDRGHHRLRDPGPGLACPAPCDP